MRTSPGGSSEGETASSFFRTIHTHPGTFLLVGVFLACLLALEGAGYLRDVERPGSVDWLFKPRSK